MGRGKRTGRVGWYISGRVGGGGGVWDRTVSGGRGAGEYIGTGRLGMFRAG